MVGKVWPGKVNFPDFNHPNSTKFWIEGLNNLTLNYQGLSPSGIWIDMNEYSNFVLTGEILPLDKRIESFLGIKGKSQYSHLPFNPDGRLYPLYYRTVSLDGIHYSNPADALYIK